MTRAWFVMLVSAFTNGGITLAAGVSGVLMMPRVDGKLAWTWELIVVQILFAAGVAFRYISSQLKMTPEITAELLGKPVIVTTVVPETATTPAEVVTKGPAATVIERHVLLPPAPVPPAPPMMLSDAMRAEVQRLVAEALAARQPERA